MSALQRWQRRAVVVLAWLVLALSSAPLLAQTEGRAPAALVCAVARLQPVRAESAARAPGVRGVVKRVQPALRAQPEHPRSSAGRVAAAAPPQPERPGAPRLYLRYRSLLN